MSVNFKAKIFSLILCNSLSAIWLNNLYVQNNTAKEIYYAGIEMGSSLLRISIDQINAIKSTSHELNIFVGYFPFGALRLDTFPTKYE
jgi:hypothetical protein